MKRLITMTIILIYSSLLFSASQENILNISEGKTLILESSDMLNNKEDLIVKGTLQLGSNIDLSNLKRLEFESGAVLDLNGYSINHDMKVDVKWKGTSQTPVFVRGGSLKFMSKCVQMQNVEFEEMKEVRIQILMSESNDVSNISQCRFSGQDTMRFILSGPEGCRFNIDHTEFNVPLMVKTDNDKNSNLLESSNYTPNAIEATYSYNVYNSSASFSENDAEFEYCLFAVNLYNYPAINLNVNHCVFINTSGSQGNAVLYFLMDGSLIENNYFYVDYPNPHTFASNPGEDDPFSVQVLNNIIESPTVEHDQADHLGIVVDASVNLELRGNLHLDRGVFYNVLVTSQGTNSNVNVVGNTCYGNPGTYGQLSRTENVGIYHGNHSFRNNLVVDSNTGNPNRGLNIVVNGEADQVDYANYNCFY